MSSWEQVHGLMVEVGDLLELPQVTELPDDDHWRLVGRDGAAVLVDYDRAADQLVLATMLGQPAAGARERVYEMLLLYNGAARETGGARMLLDQPGGEPVLQIEVPADGLDASGLAAIIGNVQEVAGHWRRLVAATPGPVEDRPASFLPFDMIRG